MTIIIYQKLIGKTLMQKIDKETRSFGLLFSLIFLLWGAIIPYFKRGIVHPVLLVFSGVVLILALIRPSLLTVPRKYWLWIGEKLGAINSFVLLTVLYYTLFTITHLIFVLTGRDQLKLKWKKYQTTLQRKEKISSFREIF